MKILKHFRKFEIILSSLESNRRKYNGKLDYLRAFQVSLKMFYQNSKKNKYDDAHRVLVV